MATKSKMPTLERLAQDMASLADAPAGADLSRLKGALRILIEMTRYQEREACAKICQGHSEYLRNQWEASKEFALHAAGVEAEVLAHAILSRSNA